MTAANAVASGSHFGNRCGSCLHTMDSGQMASFMRVFEPGLCDRCNTSICQRSDQKT